MSSSNLIFAAAGGDNTPDAFNFTDQTDVQLNTVITSNTLTITGITGGVLVSCTGGTVSINGGSYVSSGTIANGQTVTLRLTSSNTFITQNSATLTIGTISDTWYVTTRAADTVSNPFSIAATTGVEPGSVNTSNEFIIDGIEPNYSITVTSSGLVDVSNTSGTGYSGTFASSKTITANASGQIFVKARATASASFSSVVSINVNCGTNIGTYSVTTRAADTTPAAFGFTSVSGVELNTVNTSNTVTVTGLEPNFTLTVSVTGGTVDAGTSVLSGTFAASKSVTTSGSGTLVVATRTTASSSFATTVASTVTIGGVNGFYSVTTRPEDSSPDSYTFTNATGAEPGSTVTSNTITVTGLEPNFTFNISTFGGTNTLVDAGTSTLSGTFAATKNVTTSGTGTLVVAVRTTAPSGFSSNVSIDVYVANGFSLWSVTTRAADTTGLMTFTDQSGANLSTVTTSSTITATGFEPNYTFTITSSGGTIDTGTTTLSGTFASSKSVTTSGSGSFVIAARITSSSSFSTAVNCTVTAGNTTDTFTVTTRAADTTPDAFSFTSVSGVELNSTNTSNTVTVTGLEPNHTVTVSVSGGTVDAGTSTLSGTYAASKSVTTSGTGTLVVATRITASSSFSTGVTSTVTIGGINGNYTVTTRAADTTGLMSFTDQSGVELSTVTTSNTVTATGFEPNYTFTVTSVGGTIDTGTTTLSGTFASSKSVTTSGSGSFVIAARITSSSLFGLPNDCLVTAGNTTDTFTVTTRAADTTPDAFSFTSASGVEPSSVNTSNTITITGLEPNISVGISASGGLVDGGTTTPSGTFAANKSIISSGTGTLVVVARVTASSSFSTSNTVTITVGTGTATYTATTRAADTTPNPFSFTNVTNASLSTQYTSNTVTVGGLEPNYSINVYPYIGGTLVDAGTSTLSGTFSTSKTVTTSGSGTLVVATRLTSSSSFSTLAESTVVVGSGDAIYSVTTRAADTTPDAFNFTNVSGVEPNSVNTSNTITVTGLEPNHTVNISASNGSVSAGTSTISGTYSASTTATTSGTGTLVVSARVTASSSFSTGNTVTVTVGSVNGTYTATTRAADTTGLMSFTDQSGVELSTVTTSNTVTATGFEPNYTFTVTSVGGTIDTGTTTLSGTFASSKSVTTSGSGSFVIAARITSSSLFGLPNDCLVTAGNTTDTFTVTTRAADTTPDAFSFTSASGVEPSSVNTSNTVTITGLEPNISVGISASGGLVDGGTSTLSGTYAANKSIITSGTGTIVVAARVTASSSFATGATVTITVGTGNGTYTATTRAADTTGSMVFTDQTGINPSTVVTSNTVTASGFEPNYTFTVSCTGGLIDTGTSVLSGTFATSKSVTTSGSGSFVIAARVTSSSSFGANIDCTVTAGNTVDTFSVTNRAADETPDNFSITSSTSVEPNSVNTSSTVTITGLEPNYSITVSAPVTGLVDAGTSVLSGTFATSKSVTTSGTGTIVVAARGTAPSGFSNSTNVTVQVGTLSRTYTISTRPADTTGTMTFIDQGGANLSTVVTSSTVTATGFEPNYTFTITSSGGTIDTGMSTLSGTFASSKSVTTSGSGTFVIAAQVTSGSSFIFPVNCVVTAGNTSDIFTVTTRDADRTPNAFSFTSASGVEPSSVNTSNTVTITGLEPNISVDISASGGLVDGGTSVLSGTYAAAKSVTTSGTGTIVVAARVTASSSFATGATTTITVGTGTATYTATTRAADTTPAAFGFTSASNVEPNSVNTSNTVTVTGLEPNFTLTVSVTGGTVDAGTSALSGTYAASKSVTTSGTGTLVVATRVTASSSFSTSASSTVTIGGVNGSYSVTTRPEDSVPNSYSFVNATGAEPGSTVTSNTITVTGLEPNFTFNISTFGGTNTLVDGGTSTTSGTFATTKNVTTSGTGTLVVAVRTTAPSGFSSNVSIDVYVANGFSSWSVTTRAADTTGTISFPSTFNVQPSTQTTSSTVTATGFEPNYTFTVSCTGGTIDTGTSTLSGTFASSKSVTTSGSGTFVIAARGTSSATFSGFQDVIVTAGNTTSYYTIQTRAPDSTPNAFSFTDATNVNPSTAVNSGTLTITGLEPSATIPFSNVFSGFPDGYFVEFGGASLGGTNSIANGSGLSITSTASGTIVMRLSTTSPATFSTTQSGTVTLGGVSDTWSVTTRPVDTSGSFPGIFSSVTGALRSTLYTSTQQTVSGLEPSTTFTFTTSAGEITGGTGAVDGVWATSKSITTSITGTAVINVRLTSSSSFNTGITANITCNGTAITSGSFTVTTAAADTVGNMVFTDQSNVMLDTQCVSNLVTATGFEPNYTFTINASGGQIDAGTTALSGSYANSKSVTTSGTGSFVIRATVLSDSFPFSTTSCVVTAGNTTDSFSVTTGNFLIP